MRVNGIVRLILCRMITCSLLTDLLVTAPLSCDEASVVKTLKSALIETFSSYPHYTRDTTNPIIRKKFTHIDSDNHGRSGA